jgi:excisionase family DNA binding protein
MEEKTRRNLITGNKPLSIRVKGVPMSKKKLFNLYKYQGGLKPDPDENDEPIEYEEVKEIEVKIKEDLNVQTLTTNVDHNLDGELDEVRYISVSEYANYINRPKTTVYRMIREGEIQSIKLKNKLHVILD